MNTTQMTVNYESEIVRLLAENNELLKANRESILELVEAVKEATSMLRKIEGNTR